MKILLMMGGGLDSCTLAAHVRKSYPEADLFGLWVNYGQKAAMGERTACRFFAQRYSILFKSVGCELGQIAASPILEGGGNLVSEHRKNLLDGRNLVLFGLGIVYAQFLGASRMYVALHKEPPDAPFRDATETFRRSFEFAAAMGTQNAVKVIAPFSTWDRQEILRYGLLLDPDIETESFTCYESPTLEECGICTHCQQKKEMVAWVKNAQSA